MGLEVFLVVILVLGLGVFFGGWGGAGRMRCPTQNGLNFLPYCAWERCWEQNILESPRQTGMKAHETGRKQRISLNVAWCTHSGSYLKALNFEATGFAVAC